MDVKRPKRKRKARSLKIGTTQLPFQVSLRPKPRRKKAEEGKRAEVPAHVPYMLESDQVLTKMPMAI
jgi:hypothetical protein